MSNGKPGNWRSHEGEQVPRDPEEFPWLEIGAIAVLIAVLVVGLIFASGPTNTIPMPVSTVSHHPDRR